MDKGLFEVTMLREKPQLTTRLPFLRRLNQLSMPLPVQPVPSVQPQFDVVSQLSPTIMEIQQAL